MKPNWNVIVPVLTLILLAVTQYAIVAGGGAWNPGLIGLAGLVAVMMIWRRRGRA